MPSVAHQILEEADKLRPSSPHNCPLCQGECVDCHEPLPKEELGNRCFRNTSVCPPDVACIGRLSYQYDFGTLRRYVAATDTPPMPDPFDHRGRTLFQRQVANGATLPAQQRRQLVNILAEANRVFAWTPEMTVAEAAAEEDQF